MININNLVDSLQTIVMVLMVIINLKTLNNISTLIHKTHTITKIQSDVTESLIQKGQTLEQLQAEVTSIMNKGGK